MNHDPFIVPSNSTISLSKDYDPAYLGKYQKKEDTTSKLQRDVERLAAYQDILYANNCHALLIIFQAMDAAGKDSTIKYVMSGINPQGCQVFSFNDWNAQIAPVKLRLHLKCRQNVSPFCLRMSR